MREVREKEEEKEEKAGGRRRQEGGEAGKGERGFEKLFLLPQLDLS